jgi:hypothetical protein
MATRVCAFMILLTFSVGVAPLIGGIIVGDPTGLASPAVTITFTEFGIPDGTVVTNQYSSLGVILSSGMYQATGAVVNFGIGGVTSPFSIYFTSPQTSAAVNLVTNSGTSSFSALLGGALVDSFSASTGAQAYYGFTGESFDQIQITPGGFNNMGVVVNVQLGAEPVPEPSTYALLGCGLLGLLAFRRKQTA